LKKENEIIRRELSSIKEKGLIGIAGIFILKILIEIGSGGSKELSKLRDENVDLKKKLM
jgi:hypothetical protein